MDFRIRQLQCFLTLAELLNYNRTARTLYMSQPTITFQIKSLEEALGVKLFLRDRQRVQLTDAGRAFRQYAQTMMNTLGDAHEFLSQMQTRLRLRICCGPVGQFVLLPAVLRALTAGYPEFVLEVIELTTEQQIASLPEGKVDAMLMVNELPIAGMRFEVLSEEELVAMISRHSPLADQESLSVEALRETPLIASRLADCRFHQPFLHGLLAPFGITPRIVESPQSCAVQFAYAAAGEGIALATESMSGCFFPELVARPFRETLPRLQLGLGSMSENESPALAIFREVVMGCAAGGWQRDNSGPAARMAPASQRVAAAPQRAQAS